MRCYGRSPRREAVALGNLGPGTVWLGWRISITSALRPLAHHVSSGKDQLIVLSDTTNIPALFATNPGWRAVFDQDAPLAEATRRKLFDRVVADKTRVTGYHFPFPATGTIAKDGQGYAFRPA